MQKKIEIQLRYKKILVLVDSKSSSKKKLVRYLNFHSKNKYKAFLHSFKDLYFDIKSGKVKIKVKNIDLASFDLVFVRRAGKYVRFMGAISKYLDYKKVKFVDPAFREIGMSMDKASSALRLAIKRIAVPYTIFCFKESVLINKNRIIKALGFPIIAKAILSQRNQNIYILKTADDFDKLLKKSKKEFIFQKFVDIEKEYRFLIMGEKVMVLEQKFKRNYDNLKVEYLDLTGPSVFLQLDCATQSANKIALRSANILGLDIAGVDLAIEKVSKKIFIIEVNKGPGIEPDARTSPELKAFSDYLLSRIS
ncbi:MAG: ribosomal protein S6 modification protein [uncultured bacterium]|nr:MAG: ribosomal protein S6 modification protein [uncultured bacterium]